MTISKQTLLTLLLCAAAGTTTAQNGSNSTYSRFGLGALSNQSQGINKGMGGISQGIREGMQLNMLNPASYSALVEQNFVFDVGMSFQNGNFDFGTQRMNVRNATLDYVAMGFRAWKNMGMSIGLAPFSEIGYAFATSRNIGNDSATGDMISVTNIYNGTGGLRQFYYGVGWMPLKNFSIGANISYMWGEYNHGVSQQYYENGVASSNISALNRQYNSDIQTYKVDLGAQYSVDVNKKNNLILGLTASLGHKINADATFLNYIAGGDSTVQRVDDAFDLPFTLGGGFTWKYSDKLLIGADYFFQKWSDSRFPQLNETTGDYEATTNTYKDLHKIAVGAEFVPKRGDRRYYNRMRYRVGGTY